MDESITIEPEWLNGKTLCTPFIVADHFLQSASTKSVIHLCCFSPDEYEDWLYPHLGIECPEPIYRAVPKRRMEYLAGRISAKAVLSKFGEENCQVTIGEHRSPVFPAFLTGSISHSDNLACCAVALSSTLNGLGIDIEHFIDLKQIEEISGHITNCAENALIYAAPMPFEQLFTAVFSAKESIFKALYPAIGCYFDFDCAVLRSIDTDQAVLMFEIAKNLSVEYRQGQPVLARYCIMERETLTLVEI